MKLHLRCQIIPVAIALGLSPVGCSSDNSGAPAAACNAVVNNAPVVMSAVVASAAPTPTGGTISDGTYALSDLTAYTGSGSPTVPSLSMSVTIVISGTTMQQAGTINGQDKRYTTTISASGTTIATVDTCPAEDIAQVEYTASTNELRIYQTSPSVTLEQVYTK